MEKLQKKNVKIGRKAKLYYTSFWDKFGMIITYFGIGPKTKKKFGIDPNLRPSQTPPNYSSDMFDISFLPNQIEKLASIWSHLSINLAAEKVKVHSAEQFKAKLTITLQCTVSTRNLKIRELSDQIFVLFSPQTYFWGSIFLYMKARKFLQTIA